MNSLQNHSQQHRVQQLLTQHLDIWTTAETEKKLGRGRANGNAGSVYGIKKLRELILELAVRGKLVLQKGIWKELKLGEIGKWAIGSGFPTQEQGLHNEDVLFAKVSDMNLPENEKFIVVTNNTISYETAKRLRINVHSAGTVIFPKIGGAIATNKRRVLTKDTAIDNNCLGLIPKEGVSTEWLFLQLLSMDLTKYQAGTSLPALSQGVLQEIRVTLPNPDEQHCIVTKVDELMALCDQLENQHLNTAEAHETLVFALLDTLTHSQNAAEFQSHWQRIAQHFDVLFTTEASIDALKQTLLQLAIMGKIVPQDPNDEPSSELLKRIQAEKAKLIAEGKLKKEKPLAPITEDEKPFELPKGWEWVRFPELGEFARGKSKHRPRNDPSLFNPPIYPLVQTGEVARAGYVIEEFHSKYSEIGLQQSRMWAKGTLCITIAANIADSAILGFDACFPDSVVGFSPNTIINSAKYFLYFMKTARDDLLKFAPSTAQKNINLEILESVLIPTPPLAEQLRIVAKVDALMALCDQLKTRINQASRQQQLLADVFVEQALA